jgi:luciferase family oxidoreductase group 1
VARTLKLGVLDQSPIRKGGTAAQAMRETLDLARLCDRLGYHRYWVAEHHASEALAGSAPEILIARVASLTQRMRVGSGGVMLPHYSALKVAEQFRVLETLYPGRIDLGIGRAPGSDRRTAHLLQAGPQAHGIEYFPYQIRDLLAWLHDVVPEGHQGHGISAQPIGESAPEVWLLGSSDQSAAYAAHFGLPFCYAHFIEPQAGVEVMRAYLEQFRAGPLHDKPQGTVGISVLCAETDAEADRLAASREFWAMKRRTTGEQTAIPTVEEALAYPYSERERALMQAMRRRAVVGSPKTVREGLERHAEAYGVDEFLCVTITYDFEARQRSYVLLAEEFGLDALPKAAD